jgi:predicted HD phosphohydrolase
VGAARHGPTGPAPSIVAHRASPQIGHPGATCATPPLGTVLTMDDPRRAARRFTHADELIDHLRELGDRTSVESDRMTELDHGLQCAAILARTAPDDVELQVAGLVHDLAHPWDGPGQPRHATMGAAAVTPVLGPRVAELIRSHVPAKRYLVAVRADYAATLSPDSVMTLAAQGGPMSAEEVAAFEQRPDLHAEVLLREADDRAKTPGADVPGLGHWEPAIRSLADRIVRT